MATQELKTRFTGDDTSFTATAKRVEKTANGLSSRMMRGMAGLGLGTAFVGVAQSAMQSAKEITAMADALDLTTTQVQTLEQMAEEMAVPFGQLQNTLSKIDSSAMEALSDSGSKSAQNFKDLGISLAQLRTMTAAQRLEAIGRALKDGAGNANIQSAAYDLMGGRSARLQEVLQQLGTEGFGKLGQDMIAANQIMTGETMAGIMEAERAFDDLGDAARTAAGSIVSAFVEAGKFWGTFFGNLVESKSVTQAWGAAQVEQMQRVTESQKKLNEAKKPVVAEDKAKMKRGEFNEFKEKRVSDIAAIGGALVQGERVMRGNIKPIAGMLARGSKDNIERDQLATQKAMRDELVKLNQKQIDMGAK